MPDPNVLVSAAIKPNGVAAEVVRAAFDEHVRFVVCPALIAELRDVLRRERFRTYLSVEQADAFIDALEAVGEVVADPPHVRRRSRDPKDDYLLALAGQAGALDGILSGDDDLVVEDGPAVLSPREILDRLELNSDQRALLLVALWNLRLAIDAVAPHHGDLEEFVQDLHRTVLAVGGLPTDPVFGVEDVPPHPLDVRRLGRTERTVCAYALSLTRDLTGRLHASAAETQALKGAFEILDRVQRVERLL